MKNCKTKLILTILLVGMMFVLLTFASQASSADGSPWLKDETGGTSDWYTPDDSDGALPDGSVIWVIWVNGENGAQPADGAADPWQTGSLNILDTTVFPDDGFRTMLKRMDADQNGGISREEAKSYFEKNGGCLDLREAGITVLDFTGVECFAEWLTSLRCFPSYVTPVRLDVSGLPLLEELVCRYCGLTELDLSGNPALRILECDGNPLGTLDISACPLLVDTAENGSVSYWSQDGDAVSSSSDASVIATVGYTLNGAELDVPYAAVLVLGSEDPEPDEPDDPAQEQTDDPVPKNGALCKWDGKDHGNGIFGRITAFVHSVLYFFAHLFGLK